MVDQGNRPIRDAEQGPAFVGKSADQTEVAQGIAEDVGDGATTGKKQPAGALQEFGCDPEGVAQGLLLAPLQQDEHHAENKIAKGEGENNRSYIQEFFHPCLAGDCCSVKGVKRPSR